MKAHRLFSTVTVVYQRKKMLNTFEEHLASPAQSTEIKAYITFLIEDMLHWAETHYVPIEQFDALEDELVSSLIVSVPETARETISVRYVLDDGSEFASFPSGVHPLL